MLHELQDAKRLKRTATELYSNKFIHVAEIFRILLRVNRRFKKNATIWKFRNFKKRCRDARNSHLQSPADRKLSAREVRFEFEVKSHPQKQRMSPRKCRETSE